MATSDFAFETVVDILCNKCCTSRPIEVILAGTLTRVQGNIRCKVLAALSKVKYLLVT